MRLKQIAACVFVAVVMAPSVSQADDIDFIPNQGLRSNVSISLSGVYSNLLVGAGELVWDWITPTPTGFTDIFYSYCVDLLYVLNDPQTVTRRSTTEYHNAGTVDGGIGSAAYLFNANAAAIHASGNATLAAGLQVAIWELLYDNNSDLSAGSFVLNTTGAIRTAANGYLATLFDGSGGRYSASATWLDTLNGQDQMTFGVSEPSTLLLLGTAMLIAASRLRRPRAKARQLATAARAVAS